VTKPFGVRAAVETAERLAAAIKAGDKREGEKAQPWEKLKFDRQIIAISLVEGATAIYSNTTKRHAGVCSPSVQRVPPQLEMERGALPLR